MISERADFLQKLQKGLGHMMNRKLASGFAGWLSGAHGNAAMSKGLRHMLNRELSRGWRCFVAYYASVLAKRESMRKSLGHLLNRELSRGLDCVARHDRSELSFCRSCTRVWGT